MTSRWRRRRSLAEIRLRLAQSLTVLAERLGYARGPHTTVDYESPRFPSLLPDAAKFQVQWPAEASQLLSRADHAAEGRFELLGFKSLDFGHPIDWHLDPVAGKRSPLVHWSRVPFLDASVVGDHKVVWELNRHQHFVTLGQAYWLTRDERYAQAFVQQLETWIESNPPKLGINWASSLEIALRSISWIWALRLFESSPSVSDEIRENALKLLETNASHVATYLSTYFSPNTHLTGEALGLLYIGTAFPSLRRASEWRDLGTSILVEEIGKQLRPDGVYFEQSTWYQAYTVAFYLHAILLSKMSNNELPSHVHERVESACEVLRHVTRPDGCISLIGDDDGGRLLPLQSTRSGDYEDLLSLAALVFQRPDFAMSHQTPPCSLAWLTGEDGLRRYGSMGQREPDGFSKGFAEGGWFSLRDGSTKTANHMLVNVGSQSVARGAHAHADALSINLSVDGEPMLADPGTYTYVGAEREVFRGTAAHNTVTINEQDSSVSGGRFRWERPARSYVDRWVTTPTFDYLDAWHEGYARESLSIRHRRSVLWLKGRYWVIVDRIQGKGAKSITVHFHGASDVTAALKSTGHAVLHKNKGAESHVALSVLSAGGEGTYRIEKSWASSAYGSRVETPALEYVIAHSGQEDTAIATILFPHTTAGLRFEERSSEGRSCWALENNGFEDTFWLPREGDRGGRDGIAFCWIRRDQTHRAVEMVGIGPGSVDIDQDHLEWATGWVLGRRPGSGWRLETA